ncbi:hypothetical protein, partial [Brevibacterium casei]|uniref:hypothetical protein n=1 Tax=Brevibacterium casei TaxID=33889 RepID=UPI0028A9F57C
MIVAGDDSAGERSWFHRVFAARLRPMNAKNPADSAGFSFCGGSDRRRSGDLSIFSRTLYQLSYR